MASLLLQSIFNDVVQENTHEQKPSNFQINRKLYVSIETQTEDVMSNEHSNLYDIIYTSNNIEFNVVETRERIIKNMAKSLIVNEVCWLSTMISNKVLPLRLYFLSITSVENRKIIFYDDYKKHFNVIDNAIIDINNIITPIRDSFFNTNICKWNDLSMLFFDKNKIPVILMEKSLINYMTYIDDLFEQSKLEITTLLIKLKNSLNNNISSDYFWNILSDVTKIISTKLSHENLIELSIVIK